MRILRNAPMLYITSPSEHNLLPDVTEKDLLRIIAHAETTKNCIATIQIFDTDPDWDSAYKNWINGKSPTDSKEWKAGVFYASI